MQSLYLLVGLEIIIKEKNSEINLLKKQEEKVQELETDIQKKNIELNSLTNTDIKEIWKQELITFEEQYKKMYKI